MNEQRRTLLQAGAFAAAGLLGADGARAQALSTSPGRPGDFDFLTGEWRIANRRLTAPNTWDEFEGEATCWGILGGVCAIEELRIPARNFAGMGLRLLDVQNQIWTDYWINARSGVLGADGHTGGFSGNVGTFGADDMDGDQPIKVRGVWDNISPTACRWRQAVSRDSGASWEENWLMDWTRVR